MSKQVRFRRGTTVQHSTFTGVAGEVTIDTTKNVPVVHNGTTAGGIPLLREDRPRGWTKMEIFTTTGSTYTIANKTDLKRIRVTVHGGGGGGNSQSGGGGGGMGGYGFRIMELNELTTNTTVTIGSGGAVNAAGGSTIFGSYITATGGAAGGGTTANGLNGGAGGTVTGTNVVNLGAQGGRTSNYYPHPGYGAFPWAGGTGGGFGGGGASTAAQGIRGGGGGYNAAGAQGCVIVEEIYGYV